MAEYLMIIESRCKDPERDAEFNVWYDTVHLPDVSSQPGFVKVTRWVEQDTDTGEKHYVMLCELETDDLEALFKAEEAAIAVLQAQGRLSDLFVPVSRRVFKQAGVQA